MIDKSEMRQTLTLPPGLEKTALQHLWEPINIPCFPMSSFTLREQHLSDRTGESQSVLNSH